MLQSVEDVGFEMGWEKAWEKAWEQRGIELAKSLILSSHMPKKEIAKHTGLELREIDKLEKELKSKKQ